MNAYLALYRVDEVLRGHSDRVAVLARDAAGAELRIDLPLTAARDLEVGCGLVVQLSAHCIPVCPRPEAPPSTAEPLPTVRLTLVDSPRLESPCVADEKSNAEICRLLGLA